MIFLIIFIFQGLTQVFTEKNVLAADQTNQTSWQEVQNAFKAQNYDQALEELKKQPLNHAAYYYNLGTLYCKKGQWALGLGYLEKAAQNDPHDPEIYSQIKTIENVLQIKNSRPIFVDRLSLDEIRGVLGFLGTILILSYIRNLIKKRSFKKTIFQPATLIITITLLFTFGLYLLQRWNEKHPLAIALESKTSKSGPAEHFSEIFSIYPGERLRILSKQENPLPEVEIWYQVRNSSHEVGWIKKKSLFITSEEK